MNSWSVLLQQNMQLWILMQNDSAQAKKKCNSKLIIFSIYPHDSTFNKYAENATLKLYYFDMDPKKKAIIIGVCIIIVKIIVLAILFGGGVWSAGRFVKNNSFDASK